MIINHNMMAMNTHRQLGINGTNGQKSIEKLSSGMRINKAGDDAAGLAISEKMRAQVRGLNQASRNSQDGISMIQTAEGSLQETQAILQRMRELAVQSSNDTLAETDREKIQSETDELAKEITRIANTTEFNTKNMLNGGLTSNTTNGTDVTFHIGANKGQSLTFGINAMDAQSLGVAGKTADVTGTGDVSSATVSGSAAAVTNGNVVTATTSSVFGGTVSGGNQIDTVTATSGGSVVEGASIDISVAIDTAATAGTAVGNATYANIAALNTALGDCSGTAKTLVLNIDGADQTITFNGNYSAGDAFGSWADAKTAIDAQLTGATFTGADGAGLTFTSGTTGSTSAVTVTTDASTLMGGAPVETAGQDADYAVTFDDGTTVVTVTDVAGDAANVTGTGVYSTLSFATGGTVDATTAGTIDIGTTYTVTLSDGTNTDSVISGLAVDATSATGSGDFAGFTLTLDGALADTNVSTITVTSGSAASIAADGTVTDAVADAGIDVSTSSAANNAIDTINTAINTVSEERSKLGALQNRLEHTIKNLDTSSENMTAAESRVRDVDMAKEMMEFTKNNILQQAAQSMLAQANQAPQGVLQLLR